MCDAQGRVPHMPFDVISMSINNKSLNILWLIVILLWLPGCNLPLSATPVSLFPTATSAAVPSASLAPVLPGPATAPAGWQQYSDPILQFSMSHPADWQVCSSLEISTVFCGSQAEGASFPTFYVTLIELNDLREGYNVLEQDVIQSLAQLDVGQTFTTGDPAPEFSTFTRLPDVQVGGETGIMIENARVWEGNPETKDRRVFVRRGETWFMIGTYYESPEALATFQSVLDSLRFD